ncbi:MAG: class I mannose-6-phosphate isomerase, partial [Thermomicrobiales bacterium]
TTHIRTYTFGERLIPEKLGKTDVPETGRVSETWEISDQKDARATIVEGPWTGRLLNDLTLAEPDGLVGLGWRGPHFPLLGKFLDASHMLPVHLHANDADAASLHGEPNGKSEAWHILWCEPGTTILTGIKPGNSDDDLRAAFKDEDYERVMYRHPLRTGDTVHVPGGILHSFGPDTLIFEIQQTSDLSQHVMPSDIYGNRLAEEVWDANIDRTLAELHQDYLPIPNPGLEKTPGEHGNRARICCAGPHFALERWTLAGPHTEPSHPERCVTLSNVGDPVTIRWAGGETSLGRAESCILPAALGETEIIPSGEGDLIACYVPDLERDIIAPLRAAGHSDAAIGALGEVFQTGR